MTKLEKAAAEYRKAWKWKEEALAATKEAEYDLENPDGYNRALELDKIFRAALGEYVRAGMALSAAALEEP